MLHGDRLGRKVRICERTKENMKYRGPSVSGACDPGLVPQTPSFLSCGPIGVICACLSVHISVIQNLTSRLWIIAEVIIAHALDLHSLHCFPFCISPYLEPIPFLLHICFSKTLIFSLPHIL